MAKALWLCTKTIDAGTGGQRYVDGVFAVVINSDDGQTAAQTIAEAVVQCQANNMAVPTGYFDSAVIISNLTSGPLQDDTDCYVMSPFSVQKVEA